MSSDLTIVQPTNGGLSITTSGCLEYQAALDMARAHLVDELAYYQPVPGVNYLPAGSYTYNRVDETDLDEPVHDRHTIGYSDTGLWYQQDDGVAA